MKLSITTDDKHSLTDLVDLLFDDFSEEVDMFGDRLTLIRGVSGLFSSGQGEFVRIDMDFIGCTKDTIEQFRPIFAIVAKIFKERTGEKLEITIAYSDGEERREWRF